jgi:hypothetical protein
MSRNPVGGHPLPRARCKKRGDCFDCFNEANAYGFVAIQGDLCLEGQSMIGENGGWFSRKIVRQQEPVMARKSGNRFSGRVMLRQDFGMKLQFGPGQSRSGVQRLAFR